MYKIEDFENMRGFSALTQGEERVELMLIDNATKYKGKAIGFKKTRKHVLEREFDREAVVAVAEFADSVEVDEVDYMTQITLKYLIERVVRDFVPVDFITTITKAFSETMKQFGGDVEKSVDNIKDYLKNSPKVVDLYRHSQEFIGEKEEELIV